MLYKIEATKPNGQIERTQAEDRDQAFEKTWGYEPGTLVKFTIPALRLSYEFTVGEDGMIE